MHCCDDLLMNRRGLISSAISALIASLIPLRRAKAVIGLLGGAAPPVSSQPGVITSSALPGAYTNHYYALALQALGGTAPYSWSLVSATPNTGSWINVASNGLLTGSPGTAETESIVVKVTDNNSLTATLTLSLPVTAVSGSLAVSTSSLPNATAGGSYFYQLAASGGVPPYRFSASAPQLLAPAITNILRPQDSGGVANSSVITVNSSVASNPYSVGQVVIPTNVGGTDGMTQIDGLIGIVTAVGGSSGAWTVTVNINSSTFNAYVSGGYLMGNCSFLQPSTNLWTVDTDGWLYGAPTASESVSLPVTVIDAAGNTATATLSLTTNATLAVMGQALHLASTPLAPALASTAYSHTLQAAGGTAPYTFSISSGSLPSGLSLSSAGVISGTPSAAGTSTGIVVKVTDNASNTASATFSLTVGTQQLETRPSYNTGVGYFVKNGALYDPSGNLFTMRGICRNHYDINSTSGMQKAGINTVRYALYTVGSGGIATQTYVTDIANQHLANDQLAIVGCWYVPGTTTLCSGDSTAADMDTCASWWASAYPTFAGTQVNGKNVSDQIIIELMNEPSLDNSDWLAHSESAITTIRNAGWTCPIMLCTNGQGQSVSSIVNNAATLLAADPQKNIIFDFHLYGGSNSFCNQITDITNSSGGTITFKSATDSNPFDTLSFSYITSCYVTGVSGMTQINGQTITITNPGFGGSESAGWEVQTSLNTSSYGTFSGPGGFIYSGGHVDITVPQLAAVRSTGAAILVGEFGPGRGVGLGTSPNWVPGSTTIMKCEQNGLNWTQWAFDDADDGTSTTQKWWGMTLSAGVYTEPSSLTAAGINCILNPIYGLTGLATPPPWMI
jgi:hypothetical protein